MSKILEVEKLSYAYPKSNRMALEFVSFQIEEGEIVGIIGPNGSGKTTLIKSILAVNDYKGSIRLYDHEIKNIPRRELSKIVGVVAQEFIPIYDMKVSEIVEMGRTPYTNIFGDLSKDDREYVDSAFKALNISHLKDRMFYSLSGGERQIVYTAKTFAQNSKLFLLDEATVHLDIGNAQHLLLKIKERVSEFKTTVLATFHDINQASAFSDRIIVMKSGKIYSIGKPAEVLTEKMIKDVYAADCNVIEDPASGVVNVFMNMGEKRLTSVNSSL